MAAKEEMFIWAVRREDGPADGRSGRVGEWQAESAVMDTSDPSCPTVRWTEPARGSGWIGREGKQTTWERTQIRTRRLPLPSAILAGAGCFPRNDWQREMKTNNCIFQTAAGKSKNDSPSNPRLDNYTAEQTRVPVLAACNRCRTGGNRR